MKSSTQNSKFYEHDIEKVESTPCSSAINGKTQWSDTSITYILPSHFIAANKHSLTDLGTTEPIGQTNPQNIMPYLRESQEKIICTSQQISEICRASFDLKPKLRKLFASFYMWVAVYLFSEILFRHRRQTLPINYVPKAVQDHTDIIWKIVPHSVQTIIFTKTRNTSIEDLSSKNRAELPEV
mmetsp:Transcript_9774/g.12835  ORF Transcript_9774/g.12835 Transcript_9774/m.12835 type:complete len:183 (-) Transcript_9774:252-800(-)